MATTAAVARTRRTASDKAVVLRAAQVEFPFCAAIIDAGSQPVTDRAASIQANDRCCVRQWQMADWVFKRQTWQCQPGRKYGRIGELIRLSPAHLAVRLTGRTRLAPVSSLSYGEEMSFIHAHPARAAFPLGQTSERLQCTSAAAQWLCRVTFTASSKHWHST